MNNLESPLTGMVQRLRLRKIINEKQKPSPKPLQKFSRPRHKKDDFAILQQTKAIYSRYLQVNILPCTTSCAPLLSV